MIYISDFRFPNVEKETSFIMSVKQTCYNTFYPFKVLSKKDLAELQFEPITILYGGNGSGKTTALNIIAEKLGVMRDTLYNRSNFFEDYVGMCSYDMRQALPDNKRIITSDDVFDYMIYLRAVNDGVDNNRKKMFDDYLSTKYSKYDFKTLEDYDELKKLNETRRSTQSKYIRDNLMENVREHSNGESAFRYFLDRIKDDGLYLLDEPENSLSSSRQKELVGLIEDAARFFGCQFIIATHSPFILSAKGAKIYDLDDESSAVKKWTELQSVRDYYDLFKAHEKEFL